MGFAPNRCCAVALFVLLAAVQSAWSDDLEDLLPNLIGGQVGGIVGVSLDRPEGEDDGMGMGNTVGTGATITGEPGLMLGLFSPSAGLGAFSGLTLSEFQNLPVGSSVAAFTFAFDPEQNIFVRQQDSLGPVLADRADTLGRGKINIGMSYSRVDFKRFEHQKLSNIQLGSAVDNFFAAVSSDPGAPVANSFLQLPDYNFLPPRADPNNPAIDPSMPVTWTFPNPDDLGGVTQCGREDPDFCSYNGPDPAIDGGPFNFLGDGPPGDYTLHLGEPSVDLDLDLKVDLVNLFFAVGVHDRVDLGVVIPILKVHMKARVTTSIPDLATLNSLQSIDAYESCLPTDLECLNEAFFGGTADVPFGIEGQLIDTSFGNPDTLTQSDINTLLTAGQIHQVVSDSDSSSGLGDIILRSKWNFYRGQQGQVAVRTDLILPTGDESEFLGTGEFTSGFNLIGSGSFGRIAPHANLGFQVRSGGKENHQFRWLVGADALLHERATLSVDFLGSEDLYHDGIGDTQMSIAPGIKFNPWSSIVIAGATIIRLNDQGLRANVVPTFNIEYTFQ